VKGSLSLRARLSLSTTVAIAGLVTAFAVAVIAAVSAHVLDVARLQAWAAARAARGDLFRDHARPVAVALAEYDTPDVPRVWLVEGAKVVLRSPNAPPAPPNPSASGLLLGAQAFRVRLPAPSGRLVVVDWPLAADLDLLRDMAVALVLGSAAAAAVGALLARWATRRALGPVENLRQAAEWSLRTGEPWNLAAVSGDDEFSALARTLSQLVGRLEEAHRQERQLLADAAHEMRTPLAVLQANLSLLADWGRTDPAVWKDSLASMQRTLQRLTRLTEGLLVLGRARAGGYRAREPVDMADLVRELAEDAQVLAGGRIVEGPSGPSAPMPVAADPDALRRALWALVENALAYTPPGGRIRLGVEARDGKVWVRVEDSGPGVPAQQREKVFERFYRGPASRGSTGSGLGLSIARTLVEECGGRVSLEDTPLGGVAAVVVLPQDHPWRLTHPSQGAPK
jgi:signal transduction histidine kinase